MKGEVLEHINGVWQRVTPGKDFKDYLSDPNAHALLLNGLSEIPANTPRPLQNGDAGKIEAPHSGNDSWWIWLIPLAFILAVVASCVLAMGSVMGISIVW